MLGVASSVEAVASTESSLLAKGLAETPAALRTMAAEASVGVSSKAERLVAQHPIGNMAVGEQKKQYFELNANERLTLVFLYLANRFQRQDRRSSQNTSSWLVLPICPLLLTYPPHLPPTRHHHASSRKTSLKRSGKARRRVCKKVSRSNWKRSSRLVELSSTRSGRAEDTRAASRQ